MRLASVRILILSLSAGGWLAASHAANAQVVFLDTMNRSSFNASSNGWIVQSYAKDKGNYGLVPTSTNSNTAFEYGVQVDGSGDVSETNTVTKSAFALPNPGQYLQFTTSLELTSAAASTPGLVFGVSAFGMDSSSNEYATNFEFVTSQLNTGNSKAANDRLLLTSYNDYSSSNPGGEWSSYTESGIDATSGFHTYTMQLFPNKVDFYVDGNEIAQTLTDVPQGQPLEFELNAWAPDSSWASATAPLPNNSFNYMIDNHVAVEYGNVPEPASLLLIPMVGLLGRRKRGMCRVV